MLRLIPIILCICCSSMALAEPAPSKTPAPHKIFSGNALFGFTMNTGNTRNKNANGEVNMTYRREKWRHELGLNGQVSYNKGKRNAQRYVAEIDNDYLFDKHEFLFVDLNHTRDKFSPFTATSRIAGGYGQRLLKTETMKLDLQGGPGYKLLSPASGAKQQRQIIFYSSVNYAWQINPQVSMNDKLTYEAGKDNTNVNNKIALDVKLIKNLGLQVAYRINYNTLIPEGSNNTRKLDTITNVSLMYSF